MQYTFFFYEQDPEVKQEKKNGQKVRGRAVLFF